MHWNEGIQAWILTRHQDVLDALRDPRLSAERITALLQQAGDGAKELETTFLGMMLFSDPPGHTRLRSLANMAFTPKVLEGMRSQIQSTVDHLMDDLQEPGRMEVISELADPLPAIFISDILGVADGDRDRFGKWSNDLAAFLGNIRAVSEDLRPARQSVAELTEFLRDVVARRRKEPQDDLLSALVTAEDQGDSRSFLTGRQTPCSAGGHSASLDLAQKTLLSLGRKEASRKQRPLWSEHRPGSQGLVLIGFWKPSDSF